MSWDIIIEHVDNTTLFREWKSRPKRIVAISNSDGGYTYNNVSYLKKVGEIVNQVKIDYIREFACLAVDGEGRHLVGNSGHKCAAAVAAGVHDLII